MADEHANYDELHELAVRLNVEPRVRWLGLRSDVPRLMSGADALVQTNTGPEAFGIAFIEAMLAGLPIVATRVGAIPEVVGPHGLLVDPDPIRVAEAIQRIVDSPALRAQLVRGADERARKLTSPTTHLRHLEEVLLA
jgi:glycosyltransferase involved in cell wall biosynthesis